jgi:hypothetical protein
LLAPWRSRGMHATSLDLKLASDVAVGSPRLSIYVAFVVVLPAGIWCVQTYALPQRLHRLYAQAQAAWEWEPAIFCACVPSCRCLWLGPQPQSRSHVMRYAFLLESSVHLHSCAPAFVTSELRHLSQLACIHLLFVN